MDVPSETPAPSSPSSNSSSPRSEVADELEKSGFDFMESINSKRGTMQQDQEKPFKNGLDMFADEIDSLDKFNASYSRNNSLVIHCQFFYLPFRVLVRWPVVAMLLKTLPSLTTGMMLKDTIVSSTLLLISILNLGNCCFCKL
jgi:hypothetical protein